MPIIRRFLLISLLSLFPVIASAHDPREPYADYYNSLKRPDAKLGESTSCCNMIDCEPVQWKLENDQYYALMDQRWLIDPPRWTVIPKEKLLHVPNPTGSATLCASKAGDSSIIRCFNPSDEY